MARFTYLAAALLLAALLFPASEVSFALEDLRPLTPGDLAEARAELDSAVARLDERLQADGPNGAAWADTVSLDELKSELAKSQPDLAKLQKILGRFSAGNVGLGLVWFADVRHGLENYLGIARSMNDPKAFSAEYSQILSGLDRHLQAYLQNRSPAEADWVNRALHWLQIYRQAPDRVQAVLAAHRKPNFFLEVSAGTVAAAFANRMDEVTPVTDCILGTSIYGTAQTQGEVTGELSPYDQAAVMDAVLVGQANTNNVGYNGPAQIYSVATTPFRAKKRIWINADGVFSMCSIAEAQVCSTVTGLCVDGGRLVQKIASKRVAQQKPQADAIAAQHAEQRVRSRLDQQADEMVARNNEQFQVKFRDPLLERRLFPAVLSFQSSPEEAHVVALAANPSQMAASHEPPPPVSGVDLAVRLHQSMFNNSATTSFAGTTIHEEEVQRGALNWFGSVPDELKPDPEGEPWEMTFVRQEPITLSVGDGGFEVVVRGERFVRGNTPYSGMYIKANYRIVQDQGHPKAVRQGDLDINPLEFEAGQKRTLTKVEIPLKARLKRRFDRILRPELFNEPIQPKGELAKVGKFVTSHLAAKPGWLTIGWQRVDAPPPPALPPAKQVSAR